MTTWTAQKATADDHLAPSAVINDAAYKAPAARTSVTNALGVKKTFTQNSWHAQSSAGMVLTPIKATNPLQQEKPAGGTDNYVIAP